MPDFTLYTHPQSRGLQVMWMLEECGAQYKAIPIAYGKMMKAEDFKAINPMWKVPALKHDDVIITETAAILLYLAEQFPQKQLIPAANTAARGEFYRLLSLAIHCEYAFLDKSLSITETPERSKSIGYGDFITITKTLREAINGKNYLSNDKFTVLDVYMSGLLGWARNHIAILPKDDSVFTAYLAQHVTRDAFITSLQKTELLANKCNVNAFR